MKKNILLLLLPAIAITIGCAKQGYPEGGPKDTQPPKIVRCTPPSGSTHFAAKEFYIEADEYVVMKDADNNVIISPPMMPKPTYRNKGKGIVVTITDTLQAETTYLLQFKDAIVDFTEGNVLQSFNYAFSTGSAIDTMAIAGTVLDASTHKPRENAITVMIYSTIDNDSVVLTGKPDYITRCNKDGSFMFSNIRAGQYRLIALEDADKDMHYGDNEAIAFVDDIVTAEPSINGAAPATKHAMRMSYEPRIVQRIIKSEFTKRGQITVIAAAPTRGIKIVCDSQAVWSFNPTCDTIKFWTLNPQTDNTNIYISDSTGLNDTLKLQWRPTRSLRQAERDNGTKNEAWAKWTNAATTPYYTPLTLAFTIPIDTSLHLPDTIVAVQHSDGTTTRHKLIIAPSMLSAKIDMSVNAGDKYDIYIAKDMLKNIFGNSTDTLKLKTEIIGADKYGGIIITLNPTSINVPLYVVQLTDESGKVIRSITSTAQDKIVFDYLTPGTYKIQVFADRNANGVLDPGKYWQHIQPEPIYYLDKKIVLRANWDIEETFTF